MPNIPKPNWLLIDIGGVVIAWDPEITYNYLGTLGVPKERARLFFDCNQYDEFCQGRINGSAFHKELRSILDAPELTYEQTVYAHNISIPGMVPGIEGLIKSLSEKYNLAFVTDTEDWQDQRVKELINLKDFKIFKSNEVHLLKTDEKFFTHVLGQLEIRPEEAILIDDSLSKIEVARECGIESIQFHNVPKLVSELQRRSLVEGFQGPRPERK